MQIHKFLHPSNRTTVICNQRRWYPGTLQLTVSAIHMAIRRSTPLVQIFMEPVRRLNDHDPGPDDELAVSSSFKSLHHRPHHRLSKFLNVSIRVFHVQVTSTKPHLALKAPGQPGYTATYLALGLFMFYQV